MLPISRWFLTKRERWVSHINKKLRELPSHEVTDLIRESWSSILNNHENYLFSLLGKLEKKGVHHDILEKLIDTLIYLGIDVSNVWTSMYHLSDIIGHMSKELLGEDMSAFKSEIRDTEFIEVVPIDFPCLIQIPSHQHASLKDLKMKYAFLRKEQEKLICSKNSYLLISKEVRNSSNTLIEELARLFLKRVWIELEVPLNSQALLYFRDMKSFASDLDLFYYGPKLEEVNIKLTELFFLFGIKRDLFSTCLITKEVERARIHFDVYHYFFSGRAIEINNASFSKFYKENIEGKINKDKVWMDLYPYLCRQSAILTKKGPFTLPLSMTDFKHLLYRYVNNILFGLSKKFDIDFGVGDNFFVSLSQQVSEEETKILSNARDLANHLRNVYQILSRRRWEQDIDDRVFSMIAKVVSYQAIPSLREEMDSLARHLDEIRGKYFGKPEFRKTKYLPLYKDSRSETAWKKTAMMYSTLIEKKRNSLSC